MPPIWLPIIAILILAGCSGGAGLTRALPTDAGRQRSAVITILSTNDFHGRYYPIAAGPADPTSQASDPGVETPYELEGAGKVGGFSWLAAAVEKIRRERGSETVLLVHAGDTFSDDLLGNLTQGEAMISLMNDLEYDFMAFGNHDFDYGVKQTRELSKMAAFPMRGANVLEAGSGQPFLGEPFVEREVSGVRIALLALGYHNTEWTTDPKNVQGLQFTDGIEAAHRYVPQLRSRADVVVVLSHLGTKADEILAREVEGIDLIIGGHSHDLIAPDQPVGNCRIIHALSDNIGFGDTVIRVADGKIVAIDGSDHLLWNEGVTPDARMAARIADVREPHRKHLEEVLAVAEEPIPRQYKTESPFDIWVGERLREETGAEIAMFPGIGYGISIQKGPVTRELLYTLLPHESKLVAMKLTGRQILEILEQCATNLKPENPLDAVGGLIQTAGLKWTMDLTRPRGDRVRSIRVGDSPVLPDRLYTVATQSGMLNGIHRYGTFAQGEEIRQTEDKVNELIERKMQSLGTIRPPKTGQVRVVR